VQREINRANVCDGILDCRADYADELDCPDRFRCENRALFSIPNKNVCDGRVDCKYGEDEDVDRCPGRFYCSSLKKQKVLDMRFFLKALSRLCRYCFPQAQKTNKNTASLGRKERH